MKDSQYFDIYRVLQSKVTMAEGAVDAHEYVWAEAHGIRIGGRYRETNQWVSQNRPEKVREIICDTISVYPIGRDSVQFTARGHVVKKDETIGKSRASHCLLVKVAP